MARAVARRILRSRDSRRRLESRKANRDRRPGEDPIFAIRRAIAAPNWSLDRLWRVSRRLADAFGVLRAYLARPRTAPARCRRTLRRSAGKQEPSRTQHALLSECCNPG